MSAEAAYRRRAWGAWTLTSLCLLLLTLTPFDFSLTAPPPHQNPVLELATADFCLRPLAPE